MMYICNWRSFLRNFEKFRRTCLDFYKLDPLHYYTTPGLAWDAALRMSRVDLELITNENIYNMIENSIRGGISMISTRHAKANNPSLASTYDPDLPRQDLIYLDDEAEDGYIYEVDLQYPVELHDKHDDYPLAPVSLLIDQSMYSSTQSSVFPESTPQRKLTPNLNDKKEYVVHYRNLKLYTQLGLEFTEVHRVLTFKQSPWLKQYIDFNTRQRSLADSVFLKEFKGKTQENLRKRVQVDIVIDATTLRKRVAKPSFCRGMSITDDITVVQCKV